MYLITAYCSSKHIGPQDSSRDIVPVTTQNQSTQKRAAMDQVLTWYSVRLIRYEIQILTLGSH